MRILIVVIALLGGCAESLPPIADCEPRDDIIPYCGMATPEDIAPLPDNRRLLLAHFGHMGEDTGSISLFDTVTGEISPLFPTVDDYPADLTDDLWGQADCKTPPDASLGPHGTHLHQLDDGRWRYLVVNHGNREAVELFEWRQESLSLHWRGCVVAAPNTMMNDVVGLDNGDIVYSRMYDPEDSLAQLKSVFGMKTGELWRWNREVGLAPLPATAAAQPNGLEIDAANEFVYANMYMERQVWQVRLSDGEVTHRYEVPNADNSAWGSDGRLWVTTHDSVVEILPCFDDPTVPCPAGFTVMALDPSSGDAIPVFKHAGAPMGAATVAVSQAGRVYMGSFVGDRMISVPDFTAEQ